MRFIIYELLYNNKNEENDNSLNIKNKVPDLHLLLKIKNNQFVFDTEKIDDKVSLNLNLDFKSLLNGFTTKDNIRAIKIYSIPNLIL